MNFKPILFSTPMIQAILDGRKTQTRRIIFKNEPSLNHPDIVCTGFTDGKKIAHFKGKNSLTSAAGEKPTCIPGDIFWAREKFCTPENWDHWPPSRLPESVTINYQADLDNDDVDKLVYRGKWRPSIHMPKTACRIFLEVNDVRVERLQDISEDDAIAEGIKMLGLNSYENKIYKNYPSKGSFENGFENPIESFMSLWESINGKKHPWKANPWVWVYDFKMIEKPKNFI